MSPSIKYLYANFLCKTVSQYIDIISPLIYQFEYDAMEDFWEKYKIIADRKPRAEWNRNRNKGEPR